MAPSPAAGFWALSSARILLPRASRRRNFSAPVSAARKLSPSSRSLHTTGEHRINAQPATDTPSSPPDQRHLSGQPSEVRNWRIHFVRLFTHACWHTRSLFHYFDANTNCEPVPSAEYAIVRAPDTSQAFPLRSDCRRVPALACTRSRAHHLAANTRPFPPCVALSVLLTHNKHLLSSLTADESQSSTSREARAPRGDAAVQQLPHGHFRAAAHVLADISHRAVQPEMYVRVGKWRPFRAVLSCLSSS